MEGLSNETTMEMLAIVEEIEREADAIHDWGGTEDPAEKMSSWAVRMRQLLGAPGTGKRRKAKGA